MNCYNRQAGGLHTFAYDVKISEFIHEYENKDKNIDVYSKALICQVSDFIFLLGLQKSELYMGSD